MKTLAELVAMITRRFHPRGTQRILKLLFNPKKLHIEAVIPYDGDLKINVNTASYVEWELFFSGYYEKWVITLMKRLVNLGDVGMDVGANIGTHALIMGKLVGNRGKVFAFDPNPESQRRLKENIDLNKFSNVRVLTFALSEKSGKMNLWAAGDKMLDRGTASLYDLPKLTKSVSEVQVKNMDEFVQSENLSRLNFIKIDTRGSDLPIIRGAAFSIDKFRPYIIFEYNKENWEHSNSGWEEAKSFFETRDYILYLVSKNGVSLIQNKTDEKTSYNIVAVPKEKIPEIKLCPI